MMEVAVHSRMQAEEVVEQPHTWPRNDIAGGGDTTADKNGMSSEEKNEGNIKLPSSLSDYSPYPAAKDINFPKLRNAVINVQNMTENNSKDKNLKASTSLTTKETNVRIDHVVEEQDHDIEEIEMEFERSFEKVHTHTPICPNCKSEIRKVVMRRRIKKQKEPTHPPGGGQDGYGCLSCFRFFFPPVEVPGTGPPGAGDHRVSPNYKSLEILKCIIYGGLMETIASMSVVSSAAASDATTLSVLAIGFATVISSIFIFGHNLKDMKNESPREISNQQVGRYEELIGNKNNFPLHATFGMLSFLIFGLIPPIVYCFAFRESNNKDYKIIAVAAASFACVVILAIGKAYVGGKKKLSDYVKVILYHVTVAVCVSGVAYAAGDLIELLIEKFGWFETAPTASDNVASWVASY